MNFEELYPMLTVDTAENIVNGLTHAKEMAIKENDSSDIAEMRNWRYVEIEQIEKHLLTRNEVLKAIQTALPYITMGNERSPSEETMKFFKAVRLFLYEYLGYKEEYKKELGL